MLYVAGPPNLIGHVLRVKAQVTAAAEGSSGLNEVLAQACNVYLESARQQWDAAGGGQLALGREVLGAMQQPLPVVGGGQLASGRKAPAAVSAVAGPRQPALPPRAARKGCTGQQ